MSKTLYIQNIINNYLYQECVNNDLEIRVSVFLFKTLLSELNQNMEDIELYQLDNFKMYGVKIIKEPLLIGNDYLLSNTMNYPL